MRRLRQQRVAVQGRNQRRRWCFRIHRRQAGPVHVRQKAVRRIPLPIGYLPTLLGQPDGVLMSCCEKRAWSLRTWDAFRPQALGSHSFLGV